MVTAASAAAVAGVTTAKSADAKRLKSPADPLNVVFVNPNYNEVLWGLYKAHCILVNMVEEDCRETNPTPLSLYNAAVDICPVYRIKGMCNGQCGRAADHKLNTYDQDAHLMT